MFFLIFLCFLPSLFAQNLEPIYLSGRTMDISNLNVHRECHPSEWFECSHTVYESFVPPDLYNAKWLSVFEVNRIAGEKIITSTHVKVSRLKTTFCSPIINPLPSQNQLYCNDPGTSLTCNDCWDQGFSCMWGGTKRQICIPPAQSGCISCYNRGLKCRQENRTLMYGECYY